MCFVKSQFRVVTSMSAISPEYFLSLTYATGSLSMNRHRIVGDLPRLSKTLRVDLSTAIARPNDVSAKFASADSQGPARQSMYVMSEAQFPTIGIKAERYLARISCFTAVCSRSSYR